LFALKAEKAEGAYKAFYRDVQKFLESSIKYLMTKLPLRNVLLRKLGCLHPLLRVPSNKILQITDLHGQPKFPSLGIVW